MESSRVNRVNLRARSRHAAFSLAAEQAEERDLRWAFKMVAKYERRLQNRENRKEVRRMISGDRKKNKERKKRAPQHLDEARLSTVECQKVDRQDIEDLTKLLVHLFQRSLRRYHLRKGARATFSVRLSRTEFLQIFGGYVTIKQHVNGKLFAVLNAKNTPDLNDQLGPILKMGKNERFWYCRRYYGADPSEARDCAYIKCDGDHSSRSEVIFIWSQEKTAQIDRQGKERSTTMGKLRCRFPRGTAKVNPSKKFRCIQK